MRAIVVPRGRRETHAEVLQGMVQEYCTAERRVTAMKLMRDDARQEMLTINRQRREALEAALKLLAC